MPEIVSISDKLNHTIAFFVLALLLDLSFDFKNKVYAISILMGYALAIEVIQYFLPTREFSLLDIFADAVGVVMYGGFRGALVLKEGFIDESR